MNDLLSKPVLKLDNTSVLAHSEAHNRPALPIGSNVTEVWHWVVQGMEDPPFWGPVSLDDVHSLIKTPNGVLRWERHTEFWSVTYAGIGPPDALTTDNVSSLDAKLVTGLRIFVRPNQQDLVEECEFRAGRLLGGVFKEGEVRVETDFWLRPNGCVNMSVRGEFIDDQDRGRFIKRLIDLEMYRVSAFKGLTLIRPKIDQLKSLEQEYSRLTISLKNSDDDRLPQALADYKQLAVDTNELLDFVRYRIAATKAYYGIVQSRMAELDEQIDVHLQSLSGFISQRLKPAVDTVIAFDNRAKQLEASVSNSLMLYNAIVESQIQQQNQQLLMNMEQRANQQVKLAKAVEGFSVIALTYYGVGLLAYWLKAIQLPFSAWILAGAVPIVGLAVWLLTHRIKQNAEKIAERNKG